MVQSIRKKVSYKSRKIVAIPKEDWVIVPGTHEPIIDKNTYKAVQERLQCRTRSSSNCKAHIFAAKVICADCKSTMNKSSSKKYSYLRCKLYCTDPKKELCTSHSIRIDQLETLILQRLHKYIDRYCDEDSIINTLRNDTELNNQIKITVSKLDKLQSKISKLDNAIKSLYLDRANGIFSENQFKDFNISFLKEKEMLIQEQMLIEAEISKLKDKLGNSDAFREIVRTYLSPVDLSHDIVNELIDFIEIGEKNTITKHQNITIHWKF